MKIHPVGANLFQADRQIDRHDRANSCSLQFCDCTEKLLHLIFRQTYMVWI